MLKIFIDTFSVYTKNVLNGRKNKFQINSVITYNNTNRLKFICVSFLKYTSYSKIRFMPNLRVRRQLVPLEITEEQPSKYSKHEIVTLQKKSYATRINGKTSRLIKTNNVKCELTTTRKRRAKSGDSGIRLSSEDKSIPTNGVNYAGTNTKKRKVRSKANTPDSTVPDDDHIETSGDSTNVRSRDPSRSKPEVLKYQAKNISINGQLSLSYDELYNLYTKRLENLKGRVDNKEIHIFRILCDRFESARHTDKAAAMSKYMRNQFEYFGIPTPERRALYKDLWKDVSNLSSSALRILAHQTWLSPEREFHYFTVEMLEKEKDRIFADDGLPASEQAVKTMEFVREFLVHPNSWWDTVDTLAPKVIGPMVRDYPEELLPILDNWNLDENRWLCRTSILHQLSFKAFTNVERLFRYSLKVAHKEEFFIQKAIGWALREYYKTDPDAVRDFVSRNKKKLSPLSVKEALKNDSKN
ncbi:unnamed protein product [Lymnaea stagnalis]|uniref:DNA alkylation repair protein n=1 Tax=Lymnaea stagnalis TaxID=6523 RepID=A0AAV2HPS2_LYMST